jgi:hypothetical protein
VFSFEYAAFERSIVKSTEPDGVTPESFLHELNVLAPQYTANKEAPLNPSDFKNSLRLILFSIRVNYYF